MTVVNPVDGVSYGFRIMGYLLGVFLAGGVVIGISQLAFSSSSIPGMVFGGAGALIIQAGFLGVMYKLIADGVATGMRDVAQAQ